MKFSWSRELARIDMKYKHMRWSTYIQHEVEGLQFHVDVAPCGIWISYFSGWIWWKKYFKNSFFGAAELCSRISTVCASGLCMRNDSSSPCTSLSKYREIYLCDIFLAWETVKEGGTSSRIRTNYLLQFECLFTACLLLYEIKHLLSQQLPFISACLVVLSQFWADGWMDTHNFGGVRWILTSLRHEILCFGPSIIQKQLITPPYI